jgi:hypothetical protein
MGKQVRLQPYAQWQSHKELRTVRPHSKALKAKVIDRSLNHQTNKQT